MEQFLVVFMNLNAKIQNPRYLRNKNELRFSLSGILPFFLQVKTRF